MIASLVPESNSCLPRSIRGRSLGVSSDRSPWIVAGPWKRHVAGTWQSSLEVDL
jgi:hypothetical protein